jgi:hypothetical protein
MPNLEVEQQRNKGTKARHEFHELSLNGFKEGAGIMNLKQITTRWAAVVVLAAMLVIGAGCQSVHSEARVDRNGIVEGKSPERPEATAFWTCLGSALEFLGPWLSCR